MTSTDSFAVDAYGCTVSVNASSRGALELLGSCVFPSLPRLNGASAPDLRIDVTENQGRFNLLVDDQPAAADLDAVNLAVEVIHVLDEAVVPRLKGFCAIHAGVVGWKGRVVLAPGGSHAGKSSLVAEFLGRGATYFSDEYALIDGAGQVFPYARPILLRKEGAYTPPALPQQWNAESGSGPAKIGWIFSLQYRESAGWNVQPIPQSVALLSLLKNTPQVLADSPNLVPSFEKAVAGAACYAGERGSAVEAVDRILALIDSSA